MTCRDFSILIPHTKEGIGVYIVNNNNPLVLIEFISIVTGRRKEQFM